MISIIAPFIKMVSENTKRILMIENLGTEC